MKQKYLRDFTALTRTMTGHENRRTILNMSCTVESRYNQLLEL